MRQIAGVLAVVAVTATVSPAMASLQEASPDSAALALISRAREARGREAAGLQAYEGLVRERLYVGLTADRFRRERALFRSERVARVRWERDGPETVRWLGIRSQVPVAGEAGRVAVDRPESLDTYPLDPTGDRLRLGDDSFLHPLADSARASYRYTLGDTMRIELPALGREIVMVEVRFAPVRSDFRLLAGSLWFDLESAALIRGVFRPSRPFNLEVDEPEDADEVPGLLKPIVVEVDVIAVEYGLYDLRWWLAHRVRFDGVARVGSVATLPVTLETVAEQIEVDGSRLDPSADPPPGWTRIVEEEGRPNDADTTDSGRVRRAPPRRRIVFYPPDDTLRASPFLSNEAFARGSDAFTKEELDWVRDRLRVVAAPQAGLVGPRAAFGGWRYNRVEALSAAVRGTAPLGSGWIASGNLRIGLGDGVPNVEGELSRRIEPGRITLRAYSLLRPAGDWGNPFSLDASASALLLGYDDGQYLRSAGVGLALRSESGPVRFETRLFGEHQRPARKHTDVSLPNLLGDSYFPENLPADRIDVLGAEARVRLQVGLDPNGWIGWWSVWGEAATADRDYARLAASAGVSHPIAGRLSGALELQSGTTWGSLPTQRAYFPGGPATLRAFPGGSIAGAAFWLGRAELAYGLPAVRLIGFGDVGWAGPRAEFASGRPAASPASAPRFSTESCAWTSRGFSAVERRSASACTSISTDCSEERVPRTGPIGNCPPQYMPCRSSRRFA